MAASENPGTSRAFRIVLLGTFATGLVVAFLLFRVHPNPFVFLGVPFELLVLVIAMRYTLRLGTWRLLPFAAMFLLLAVQRVLRTLLLGGVMLPAEPFVSLPGLAGLLASLFGLWGMALLAPLLRRQPPR